MTRSYKIYQIDLNRQGAEKLAFRPLPPDLDETAEISSEAYGLVYSGELVCEPDWDTPAILERLFYLLNMKHPADYRARSLSVSDVVGLPGDNGEQFYYCDTFEFRQVSFFPEGKIPADHI